MASPSSLNVLPVPRLRLSRRSEGLQTPGAGPSNAHYWPDSTSDTHLPNNAIEGYSTGGTGDGEQPTPKPPTAFLDSAETPAARLRAVLARIPDPNKTPVAPQLQPLPPPSEHESHYDIGQVGQPDAPSFAQKSLKDIFSRALREPGSTPRKAGPGRLRRNSVDVSEVENSPMVQQEREKMKGKKKSMSDEELDMTRSVQHSESSVKSSSASTFDVLRERLNQSHTQIKDQHLPNSLFAHEVSDTDSVHGGYILGNSADISTTPAMSSFRESFRMNMESRSHSNLLGDDSGMQRAMHGFTTSDAESEKAAQPPVSVAFPASKYGKDKAMPDSLSHSNAPGRERPRSLSAAKRLADLHNDPALQHSANGTGEVKHLHELERNWNRPLTPNRPDTPEHQHSSHSQTARIRRHSSNLSLSSASSVSTPLNGEATVKQKDRVLQREHNWNKQRPSSSLSLRSPELVGHRSRKSSISSLTDVGRRSFERTDSFSSSRASSPAGSINNLSFDGRTDSEHEVLHERERNWNAPRPKWEHQEKIRSPSPQVHEPQSPSTIRPAPRVRAQSLQSAVTKKMNASLGHISPQPSPTNGPARSPTNLISPSRIPKLSASRPHSFYGSPSGSRHNSHLRSPTTSIKLGSLFHNRGNSTSSNSQPSSSSFRITSPQPPRHVSASSRHDRIVLPSINRETNSELDVATNGINGTTAHVESSQSSASEDEPVQEGLSSDHIEVSQHLLSRDDAEEEDLHESDYTQENISILPPVVEDGLQDDLANDLLRDDTPTIRTKLQLSPPSSPSHTEQTLPRETKQSGNDGFESAPSFEGVETSSETDQLSLRLPLPPSPPQAENASQSILATPPRRSSKVEFHIPTPPRNLPDLPDPPSSSEDGLEESGHLKTPDITQQPNLTAMKTPKPPGAWLATPVQPKKISNNIFESPPKSLRTPIHELKTPRPPGAYIHTPAPAGYSADQSSSSSLGPDPTFSRATFAPQTPAPPGAYLATPAAKKSILKVRFDTHGDSTDMSSNTSTELPAPVASTPSSMGKRAGIRVLDAYGREVLQDVSNGDSVEYQAKGKGRVTEESFMAESEAVKEDTWEHIEADPMDRLEALARVRQGLSELAEGLEGLDSPGLKLDNTRIKELKFLSSQAQAARKRVTETLSSNGPNSKPLGSLRTRIQSSLSIGNSFSRSRLFWTFLLFQSLLFLFMYRASVRRAREMYLTTYFDPFYPNLHLHIPRHGSLPSGSESSLSVAEILRLEGWKASITHFLDITQQTIKNSQIAIWEAYGRETTPRDASWPPT